MKNNKILFTLLIIILLPQILHAGGFHLGIISAVKDKVEELKDKINEEESQEQQASLTTTSTLLSADTVQQITKQDGMTIYFSKNASEVGNLKTGDIIISNQGDGFLRKITSLSVSGNEYVVETSTATLEQAFSTADVTLNKELTQADINTQKAAQLKKGVSLRQAPATNEFAVTLDDVVLYDFDGNTNTTNDQIKANGSLTFRVTLDFKLEIDPILGIKLIRFVPVVKETGQLEIRSGLDIATEHEEEIARFYFSPIPVGPLVFIPEIPVLVGVKAKAGLVISSSISHEATFTSGVEYSNGTWTPVRAYVGSFQYDPPTLSAAGEIKCYIGPQAIFKIYGVVGPYFNINGYLKMVAALVPNVSWQLYGGLEVYGGVDMTIFSLYHANYTANILDYSEEIASGTVTPTNHAPVISSLTADPATVILKQAASITCTASDADNDTLTYTWSAASGTLSGSGSSVSWTAPASSGTYTVSCLVSDGNENTDNEVVSVSVIGLWQTTTLDSNGDVGAYPSLAFDSLNKPHISYYDVGNADLKYTQWTGSIWSASTVDSTGETGEYTALDLDSSGYAHISYRDYTNRKMKYAKWNGSSWSFASPISSGDTGILNTDIVLDSSGNPYISCLEQDNLDLLFAWWNGFAWCYQTIDSVDRVGADSSLAIDTANNPRVSYFDSTNADIKYASASYNISSWTWTVETVDASGTAGGFTALALDSSNNPHIVYSGGGSGYLKYAKWTGSAWSISTIDTVIASGYPSIVIDSNNRPHVSYHDYTNKDLKYARWAGSAWVVMTVDSSGNQGPESSIALDSSGNPHIAYYDATNGDLKYASWTP